MGGLIQLVATGVQNVYLTGDPQISFFKAVFKRHTNFSMECIEQNINGDPANYGTSTITISRSGDLVQEMFLEADTQNQTWNRDYVYPAERMISTCVLLIGGQQIDVHYQRWWRLYSELYHDESKKTLYSKIVNSEDGIQKVYLPFIFFFNRNPGLAIPLIGLQYHEVKLDITWTNLNTYVQQSTVKCWANYIFLDTKERNLFARKSHEYLIEQVQYTGATKVTKNVPTNVRLEFHHPVKELIWCFDDGAPVNRWLWNVTSGTPEAWSGYAGNPWGTQPHESLGVMRMGHGHWYGEVRDGPLDTFKMLFNGADRFGTQDGKYFNQVQPYYHHTGNPVPGIYSYSFALKPEVLQPSGTCNFSRIDNITAVPKTKNFPGTPIHMQMFATSYNVLRIISGMGGLAFAE